MNARLFVLALFFAMIGCQEQEKVQLKELPRSVHTVEVKRLDYPDSRTLAGTLQALDGAPLAFEVGGKVTQVKVDLGDRFAKGDLLASLETINYQLAVQQREGQLKEAKARLEQARADFARKSDLVKDQSVSQAAFEASKASFEAAKNTVDVVQTQLDLAKENLADTKLVAPYDGVIADRMMEPSQQVAPGTPVLSVQSATGLEVAVQVPENLLAYLKKGSQHALTLPALNQEMQATIREIGTNASAGNAFPITLRIENPPERARAGMSAEVTFTLDKESDAHYALPLTALVADEANGHRVFVFDPESKTVTPHSVQVVRYVGDHAMIENGLSSGEIVVSKGARFLRDGETVRPVDSSPNWYED